MKRRNRLSSKAAAAIAVAVGIRLVAIARLLLYLRLLGQVTNLFPQLTRRLSAGEPHARVRGPCAQFGGMGLEHVQQPLPVALVVPDALVVAKHALVGEDAAQPDDQMGAPLARLAFSLATMRCLRALSCFIRRSMSAICSSTLLVIGSSLRSVGYQSGR